MKQGYGSAKEFINVSSRSPADAVCPSQLSILMFSILFPGPHEKTMLKWCTLSFTQRSRVASPPAHPCLGVREAELPYEVIDTPLTLLCGRNRIWPIDGGISLPIAAVIISRSRCHHQRKDQPDAPKHRSPPAAYRNVVSEHIRWLQTIDD